MSSVRVGYGDYRDRDFTGMIGTGVDALQFPPPFPPPSTLPASVSSQQSPPRSLPSPSSTVENIFGSMDRFGRFVVSISRIGVVHCLAYPYVVFCRQCQVYPYNSVRPSLLAPLSTQVVLYHIAQSQGVGALWRGWKTNLQFLLVKPLAEAVFLKIAASRNVLLAIVAAPIWFVLWLLYPFRNYFGLIGESDSDSNVQSERSLPKRAVAYIFVKGLLQASVLLLASYSVIEMVQHTSGRPLNSEAHFTFNRPFSTMDKYRRIPYLHLLLPSFLLERYAGHANDSLSVAMNSLWVSYITSLLSETLLYPLETILVRLYCQGMPVLVDDVQSGKDVMFISTYYSGLVDCIKEVWVTEGVCGFYKGFSSLLLRYALHGTLLVIVWRAVVFVRTRSREADHR